MNYKEHNSRKNDKKYLYHIDKNPFHAISLQNVCNQTQNAPTPLFIYVLQNIEHVIHLFDLKPKGNQNIPLTKQRNLLSIELKIK